MKPRKDTTNARKPDKNLKNGISILRKSMEKPMARIAKQNAVAGLIASNPAPMLLKKVTSNIQPMKLKRLTDNTNRMEIQISSESELGLLNICGFSHVLW
jgi:hypothetical protein